MTLPQRRSLHLRAEKSPLAASSGLG